MGKSKMKITETAFTAVQQFPGGEPHVLTWATAAYANQVRQAVGEAWDLDDEGHKAGWKKAMKNGVRVVKVEMIVNT
jgi:hypothetical protein